MNNRFGDRRTLKTLALITLVVSGCPTRPMPCNTNEDCDQPRNHCDTNQPLEGARGTCLFMLSGGSTDEVDQDASGNGLSTSTSNINTSGETPCTPACDLGQRCANGQCVCDEQSCQGGCCMANRCELKAFFSCGQNGDTCLSCEPERADNCSMQGLCRCGVHAVCTTGQVCQRGNCECNVPSCSGCCGGSQCMDRSVLACGVLGSVCIGCDPVRADGCNLEGKCSCGNGPSCGLGKACVLGNCVCDSRTCPGCCDGRICNASSPVACGTGGVQCQACDPQRSDGCGDTGECTCGTGSQCLEGQACMEGQCVCNPLSCPGCCENNQCMPGTSNEQCGVAGLACQPCPQGQTCTAGVCTECTPSSCPDGCCSANTCHSKGLNTCGMGGEACEACNPPTADACGTDGRCQCGNGPACAAGQACQGGACACNAVSCPQGCCKDGVCQERSPSHCGVEGQDCQACDAALTDYCAPEGQCQCGAGPACSAGQHCVDSACLCDATSCPDGCCLGDICQPATTDTCGTAGGLCVKCNLDLADACEVDGRCGCGGSTACSVGQRCLEGRCQCSPGSCPHGCCNQDVCVVQSAEACGLGGGACVACGPSADTCGPKGDCRCGIRAPCPADASCVDGRCTTEAPSSTSTTHVASTSASSSLAPPSSQASSSSSSFTSSGSTSVASSSSRGSSSSSSPSSSSFLPVSSSSLLVSSSSAVPIPNAPTVSVQTPTNNRQPTWTWSPGGGGNGFYRYRLDDPDLSTGSISTAAASFTPTTPLAGGTHTLYVQESNAQGAWSPSGFAPVDIDLDPPGIPVVSGSSPTFNRRPTWTWVAGGGGTGTYQSRLDNNDFSSGYQEGMESSFTPPVDLDVGDHTLYVREVDAVGNWSGAGFQTVQILQGVAVLEFAGQFDLGSVDVDGTSHADQPLTVTNRGTGPATNITLGGLTSGWSVVAGGTCEPTPFTLAVDASCSVIIQFKPEVPGPSSLDLVVSFHDGTGPASQTLQYSGSGREVITELKNLLITRYNNAGVPTLRLSWTLPTTLLPTDSVVIRKGDATPPADCLQGTLLATKANTDTWHETPVGTDTVGHVSFSIFV